MHLFYNPSFHNCGQNVYRVCWTISTSLGHKVDGQQLLSWLVAQLYVFVFVFVFVFVSIFIFGYVFVLVTSLGHEEDSNC